MGYSIEIGEGLDKLTLDANIRFDLDSQLSQTSNGAADKTEIYLEIEGEIVEPSASDVVQRIIDFSEEVKTKVSPRRIRILLDNVEKFDFQPNEALGSPIVTRFRTFSDNDGGESHWRWAMSAYILLSARAQDLGDSDIVDLTTSLEVTKKNGQVIKKVWKAAARGKTAAIAETKVRSFQPAETIIKEIVETFAQEARATGVWIWEAQKDRNIVAVIETVRLRDSGADYIADTQVGEPGVVPGPAPLLHLAARGPGECEITIVVKGPDPAALAPVPPHFQEGGGIVRVVARELKPTKPSPDDDFLRTGLYKIEYTEVWLSTEPFSDLDHGDHANIVLIQPPPDGNILED